MKEYRRLRILQKQLEKVTSIICDEKIFAVASLGGGYWEGDVTYRSFSVVDNIQVLNYISSSEGLLKYKDIVIFANASISMDNALTSIKTILDSNGINCTKFFLVLVNLETNRLHTYVCSLDEIELIDTTSVIGNDVCFYLKPNIESDISDINIRTQQVFGAKTTNLLSNLTFGIVGISGTGSIVVEQLYRMNVGTLVLVDDDIVKKENLGRILNSSQKDCEGMKKKTTVQKEAVERSGLNTKVIDLSTVITEENTIRCLSQCDILIGCMDSVDGRHQLNLISTYYSIPYFDVGVKLKADGNGGVDEVTTAIHYIIPGESSLYSRGVYSTDSLEAATLLRENPDEYAKRLEEKYIIGAHESSPAVIPVNMLASSMAVLEILARIHPFREEDNVSYEAIRVDLMVPRIVGQPITKPCPWFGKNVGVGDTSPLLRLIF
jgi:hypothetical protein